MLKSGAKASRKAKADDLGNFAPGARSPRSAGGNEQLREAETPGLAKNRQSSRPRHRRPDSARPWTRRRLSWGESRAAVPSGSCPGMAVCAGLAAG